MTTTNYHNADQIIPRLWLGDSVASIDTDFLNSNNITVIFNCTKDLPFSSIAGHKYRVPIDDNLQPEEIRNMSLWSPEIALTILKEYNNGHNILVHCYAGMQRSAASVALFLIAGYHLSPVASINYIRSRRPIAFTPMPNFAESIINFYNNYITNIAPYLDKNNNQYQ